jgi:transcriptional regulator with XRE-family HTH domain
MTSGAYDMALAARLKALRAAAGLTQQRLAEKAGLHISVVTKLEYGLTPNPMWETVCALADALGCKLDDLRDLPDNHGRPEEGSADATP